MIGPLPNILQSIPREQLSEFALSLELVNLRLLRLTACAGAPSNS